MHKHLSFWISVDPCRISGFAGKGVLEDFVDSRIELVLLLVHYDCDISCCSSSGIESWPISLVFSHCCVSIDTRL